MTTSTGRSRTPSMPGHPDVIAADHRFWQVNRTERVAACAQVISAVGQTIVFCRTRHGSDRLTRQLSQRGIRAAAIHGGHPQNQRTRSLRQFTDGKRAGARCHRRGGAGDPRGGRGVGGPLRPTGRPPRRTCTARAALHAPAGAASWSRLLQPEQMGDARRMQRRIGLNEAITLPDTRDFPAASGAASQRPADAPVHNGRDSSGDAARNGESARNGREASGHAARNGQGARGDQRRRGGQQSRRRSRASGARRR